MECDKKGIVLGLNTKQITELLKIMEGIQMLFLEEVLSAPSDDDRARIGAVRPRRRGAKLISFQETVLSERKAGASVADLALKYGITPSYIYQMEQRLRASRKRAARP